MDVRGSGRNPVERLADEFIERRRGGENPTIEEYAARFPQWESEIRELFPAALVMEGARAEFAERGGVWICGKRMQRLGDYRLIREVGHGGMGVVFEAEQISLGRRVALKVLPEGPRMDASLLERFRREARTAAQLHHTNIVPIFGVGEADGLHYYAMQFIWGLGLHEVLEELRRIDRRKRRSLHAGRGRGRDGRPESIWLAESLLSGSFVTSFRGPSAGDAPTAAPPAQPREPPAVLPGAAAVQVPPREEDRSRPTEGPAGDEDGSSSGDAPRARAGGFACPRAPPSPTPPPSREGISEMASSEGLYFRSVARIGLQVAEALSYAHGQGTLHRDVKPSNLILDTAGTIWVTDFGLAKTSLEPDLTRTGDVVGTIRYLAPERFQGSSTPLCDVYGLGLTLYEMIALHAAFESSDRAQLIDQVTRGRPEPLARIRPDIPRDLDTIVAKMLERDPSQRYQSASDAAEDLRSFLEDRPIRARRTSRIEHFCKWCRRNPVVAGLTATVAVLLVAMAVASTGAAVWFAKQRDRAARAEEERGLGLVDAALTAVPQTFPHLLASLQSWEKRDVARPMLRRALDDPKAAPLLKLRAATVLTALGEPRTDLLVSSVGDAPAGECRNLAAALREAGPEAIRKLRELLVREQDSERRARFAILLLELGDPTAAKDLLARREDPVLRTIAIETFREWHGDLAGLPSALLAEPDPSFRSGVCAAIGLVARESVSPAVLERLSTVLANLYLLDPDPEVHSQAWRALVELGLPVPATPRSRDAPPGRGWFVNGLGMTLVGVPGGLSRQGDREVPYAPERHVYLTRPFWILDREVTRGLFEIFVQDPSLGPGDKPEGWAADDRWSPGAECPAQGVSLLDAVLFLNWLSRREERSPCYRRGDDGKWECDFGADGYRLPTEAEWERACRASTTTPFAIGSDVLWLSSYVAGDSGRLRPAGGGLPNQLGAFDMIGSVWEWCWDGYVPTPHPFAIDPVGLEGTEERVLRGGSVGSALYELKSANRHHAAWDRRDGMMGFRIVLCPPADSREAPLADLEAAVRSDPRAREGLWEAVYRSHAARGEGQRGLQVLEDALRERTGARDLRAEVVRALIDACRWQDAERALLDGSEPSEPAPGVAARWVVGHWWVDGPYPEQLAPRYAPESLLDRCDPPAVPGGVPLGGVATREGERALPASGAGERPSGAEAVDDGPSAESAPPAESPPERTIGWRLVFPDGSGTLHLDAIFDYVEHRTGYAIAHLYSRGPRHLLLLLASDDEVRVWLNGTLVHEYASSRVLTEADDSVPVVLRDGWNVLLAKVVNHANEHKLRMRVSGDPVDCARALMRAGRADEARGLLRVAAEETEDPAIRLEYEHSLERTPEEERRAIEELVRSGEASTAQTAWWTVGPYPPALSQSWPVETDPDPSEPAAGEKKGEELGWHRVRPDDRNTIDLGLLYGRAKDISVYAVSWIYSQGDRELTFLMGSDDGMALWLNGVRVHVAPQPRMLKVDQDRIVVTLRGGWNTVLAKVTNGTADHKLAFRMSEDPADRPSPAAASARELGDPAEQKWSSVDPPSYWVDVESKRPSYWVDRAMKAASLAQWSDAEIWFGKALELHRDAMTVYRLGLARLAGGDMDRHADACRDLLVLTDPTKGSRSAVLALWAAVLSPNAKLDVALFRRSADRATARGPRDGLTLTALGAAEYRLGRLEDAKERLLEAVAKRDGTCPAACTNLFLALTLRGLGEVAEAKAVLAEARGDSGDERAGSERSASAGVRDDPIGWEDRLAVGLLFREADSALGSGAKEP